MNTKPNISLSRRQLLKIEKEFYAASRHDKSGRGRKPNLNSLPPHALGAGCASMPSRSSASSDPWPTFAGARPRASSRATWRPSPPSSSLSA
jgi:hypothetical protein